MRLIRQFARHSDASIRSDTLQKSRSLFRRSGISILISWNWCNRRPPTGNRFLGNSKALRRTRRVVPLLCGNHEEADTARRLRQCCRAGGRDPRLSPAPQLKSEALRVDQVGRGHPEERTPRTGPLGCHQERGPSVGVRTLVFRAARSSAVTVMSVFIRPACMICRATGIHRQ